MGKFSFFILFHSVFSAYLFFSPSTNPKNSTITLPVSTGWFPNYQKIYSIEFWMRPFYPSSSTGNFLLMQNPTDWNIYYSIPANTVTISYSSVIYCAIPYVGNKNWHHIALSYDFYLPEFSCYINGTQKAKNVVSAVPKYPSQLVIGHNFTGNLAEVRVWIEEIRTPELVFQYFMSWYSQPYPTTLKRLYNLVMDPGQDIIDLVQLSKVTISSNFKTPFMQENPETLRLCNTGQFKSGQGCSECVTPCKFCSGLSTCFETFAAFLDFSRSGYSNEIISFSNFQSTYITTIELWFKSTDWTKSSAELLKIFNFFRLLQQPFNKFLTLQDGFSTEVLTFPVENNKWQHLAWVYSKGQASIYIDQSNHISTWRNTSGSSVIIGGSSTSLRFPGIIFDLRFWATPRASWQIFSNLYNILTPSTDIYRYFPLNDSISSIKSMDSLSSSTKDLIISLWRSLNCTQESCIWLCPYQSYSDSNGECHKCHWTCQACTGPDEKDCSVCLPTDFIVNGTNNCYKNCPGTQVAQGQYCRSECFEGYYNESSVCYKCITPCTVCKSKSECQACIEGYKEYDGVCKKICPTGQYRYNDNICLPCHPSCSECFNSLEDSCTECKNKKLYKGSCIDICSESTYLIENQCFDCDSSCKTCSGPQKNQCLSCADQYLYQDLQGLCYVKCSNFTIMEKFLCVDECPAGSYPDNQKICQQCDESCAECFGPGPSSCKSCDFFLFQQKCFRNCPTKTYASGSYCESCDNTCEECDNKENCTVCAQDFKFKLGNKCVSECPSLRFYNKCIEKCPFGYLSIGNNCLPCEGNCITCEENLEKCSSCPSDSVLFQGKCLEKCPMGTFVEDNLCVSCQNPCESCEGKENFCVSCLNGLKIEIENGKCVERCSDGLIEFKYSCVQQCPDGYFELDSKCLQCFDGCSVCNKQNECLKCSGALFYYDGTCRSDCPSTYYADLITRKCLRCFIDCLECKGPTNFDCLSCSDSYLYTTNEGSTCISTCPIGLFPSNSTCTNCSSNCIHCTSQESCHKCQTSYFLSDNKCSSTCNQGSIPYIDRCCGLTSFLNNSITQHSILNNTLPIFPINLQSTNTLSISYSCTPQISSGSISIFQDDLLIKSIPSHLLYSLNNSIYIPISPQYLNYSQTYSISIDPGLLFIQNSKNSELGPGILKFVIEEPELRDLICIINNNTLGQEVKIHQEILLDASQSFDPSEELRKNQLDRWWTCLDLTESFKQFMKYPDGSWQSFIFSSINQEFIQVPCWFWDYSKIVNEDLITVENLFSVNSVFLFVFSITDQSRYSESKILVRIIPETYTQVSVLNKPVFQVNPDKKLVFSAGINQSLLDSKVFWTFATDAVSPEFLTPLSQNWVLAIAQNSLVPMAKYCFSFNVDESVAVTSDVFYFEVNQPPYGGEFVYDDYEKTALVEKFIGRLVNWEDEDLPLEYSFFVYGEDFKVFRPIKPFSFDYVTEFMLSSGKLWVKGLVRDCLGSENQEIVTFDVLPQNSFEKIVGKVEDVLSKNAENSLFDQISDISALLVELNKFDQSIIPLKEKLIEKIFDFFGNCEQLTVETKIYCIISITECLYHSVQGINSAESLNSITKIFNSLNFSDFSTRQQINYNSFTRTSTQSLLSQTDQENTSYMILSILELLFPVSESPQNLLESSTILQHSLLSIDYSLNELPKLISSPKSSTFITKSNPNSSILTLQLNSLNLTLPSLNLPASSEYSIIGTVLHINSFNTTSVLLNLTLDLTVFSDDPITSLKDDLIFSVNIKKSDLNPIIIRLGSNKLIPVCVYFDKQEENWSSSGCQLLNSQEIDFSHASQQAIQISCICSHLSIFSIEFISSHHQTQATFSNIKKILDSTFDFSNAKTSFFLYILIVLELLFALGMVFAGLVDYFRQDSEIAFFVFDDDPVYTKSQKVEIFLTSLHKSYEKIAEKGQIAMELFKISKNPAFDLLQPEQPTVPIQIAKNKGSKLSKRQKKYLENKSIYKKTMIKSENNLFSIKHNLEEFENNFNAEGTIDQFLNRFGSNVELSVGTKPLKLRHLKELKLETENFFALEQNDETEIVPVAEKLTGGKYSNF